MGVAEKHAVEGVVKRYGEFLGRVASISFV
jgi:hypothetical protein